MLGYKKLGPASFLFKDIILFHKALYNLYKFSSLKNFENKPLLYLFSSNEKKYIPLFFLELILILIKIVSIYLKLTQYSDKLLTTKYKTVLLLIG